MRFAWHGEKSRRREEGATQDRPRHDWRTCALPFLDASGPSGDHLGHRSRTWRDWVALGAPRETPTAGTYCMWWPSAKPPTVPWSWTKGLREASWNVSGGLLDAFWGPPGGLLGPLGASWGHLGGLWGPLGSVLEASRRVLGADWEPHPPRECPATCFGTFLGPSWGSLRALRGLDMEEQDKEQVDQESDGGRVGGD